jgi:hypothetical protein
MATAELLVKVVTDTAAASAKLDAAGGKFGKFGGAMKKAAVPAAAIVAGIAAVGIAAVNSASRTQQAMGGVDAVFGKSAATVKKWAGDAAGSLGLAKSEYGELATLIGSQLKNAGTPMDQLAGKTKTLIEQGADMAAMYGGTTAEAVSALSGALKGEFDPLEKYAAGMSAAEIKARMVADGTDKLTGKAAANAKAMATLAIISQKTADAHGAAAREAGSTAAKTQQLAAKVENLKSDLGTALLPVMARFLGILGQAASWMAKNSTAVQIVAAVMGVLAVAVLAVNVALWAMAAAEMAAFWPIVLIVGAIALAVAAFVLLFKKVGWFRKGSIAAFNLLKAAVIATAGVIKTVIVGAFRIAATVVRTFLAVARTVFRAVYAAISATFRVAVVVVRAFQSAGRAAFSAVSTAVAWVSSAVRTLGGWLKSLHVPAAVKSALNAVKDAAAYAWGKVKELRDKLGDLHVPGAVMTAINAVKDAASSAWNMVGKLAGALSRLRVPHLSFPKPPAWMHLSSAAAGAPSVAGMGRAAAPTAGGHYSAAGAGVTINITGAVDPESTARQINRLLGAHERRIGTARGLRVA